MMDSDGTGVRSATRPSPPGRALGPDASPGTDSTTSEVVDDALSSVPSSSRCRRSRRARRRLRERWPTIASTTASSGRRRSGSGRHDVRDTSTNSAKSGSRSIGMVSSKHSAPHHLDRRDPLLDRPGEPVRHLIGLHVQRRVSHGHGHVPRSRLAHPSLLPVGCRTGPPAPTSSSAGRSDGLVLDHHRCGRC